jgi:protein TonB
LHVGIFAFLVMNRPPPPPPMPPVYRVELFAAPPGPRRIGVVRPPAATPAEPIPAAEPAAPPAPTTREREMPAPETKPEPTKRVQEQATPNPSPTRTAGGDTKAETPPTTKVPPKAPTAGGGPQGGRGTDVANVRTAGIDFPFPEYLHNVVRQIAVRFSPPDPNAPFTAQVFFLIRRNGSVDAIRVVTSTGNYEFNTEAVGAVEQAGRAGAFGALPEGFRDDVLPVYFSFDPKVIR